MKTLEDVLRESAKSGRLNYLSIAFQKGQWEASYRGIENKDFRHVTHADVACAVRLALTGRAGDAPAAPKRVKPATPAFNPLGDLL